MMDEIMKYIAKLYCPVMAEKALLPLFYSAINTKFVNEEADLNVRLRLNIMFNWGPGYWKSAILMKVRKWWPLTASVVSNASGAAIRGSFSNDGEFYPPELLISDVIIIPEFEALMEGDKELYGDLLNAMEEGQVRVALIKAQKVNQRTIDQITALGARFENKRLVYETHATFWTATHTLDGLTEHNREAICSRFHIVHISPTEIPASAALNRPHELTDMALEERIVEYLRNLFESDIQPDLAFASAVLDRMREYLIDRHVNPREAGDIFRMSVAHHVLFPHETVEIVAARMMGYSDDWAGKNSKEVLAEYLYGHPRTMDEIIAFTGIKKSNLFYHFKRLSVKRDGSRPTKYYLDDGECITSIPLMQTPLSNKGSLRRVKQTKRNEPKDDEPNEPMEIVP